MKSSVRTLYQRWIDELWNGPHELGGLHEVAGDLVTEEFVGHWPHRDVHGPAGLAELLADTKSTFAQLSFSIEVEPIVENDMVAGRWTGVGVTFQGEEVQLSGNDVLRAVGGRFGEFWMSSPQL